ncbi:hypothetical protein [Nocardioides sp. NPDC127503]|uniref:hypothetical protein n=1 Tax=Nocardioides sp. NPDC127503 TaxID=3154516 RepID=UPI00331AD0F2
MNVKRTARGDQPVRRVDRERPPQWAASTGRAYVGAVSVLAGYVVVAVTIGAGFEQDLVAAAEREGVAVNALASSTQAQITQDHPVYALVTGLLLFVSPVFLVCAVGQIRTGAPVRLAQLSWWSALATLVVWWTYVALGLGLFADPENLPPLVRDFDVLTVPLVSALSLLALGSMVFAAEALRGSGVVRRAALATTIVSILLGVVSVVALVGAGFEDPVAPIVIVPGGLILGIALLRAQRPAHTG